MKLGRWSTTAANNNSAPPDGAPEGQAASTFNDCMREIVAQVRTVFQDMQYVDQDITPTYVDASHFTLSGDQTSAIYHGRKLKLFDLSAVYATVATASYTVVTTVQISGGALSSFLSSMAIGVISNSFPSIQSLSAAAIGVSGNVSAAGATVRVGNYSISSTAQNICKAWVGFTDDTAGTITIASSFNVSSVSRSATAVYRINFTNAFADNAYCYSYGIPNVGGIFELVRASTSFKFRNQDPDIHVVLNVGNRPCNLAFFR